jgi:hypothetical protein
MLTSNASEALRARSTARPSDAPGAASQALLARNLGGTRRPDARAMVATRRSFIRARSRARCNPHPGYGELVADAAGVLNLPRGSDVRAGHRARRDAHHYDPRDEVIELVAFFPPGTPYDGPDNITVGPHGFAVACTDGEDDHRHLEPLEQARARLAYGGLRAVAHCDDRRSVGAHRMLTKPSLQSIMVVMSLGASSLPANANSGAAERVGASAGCCASVRRSDLQSDRRAANVTAAGNAWAARARANAWGG